MHILLVTDSYLPDKNGVAISISRQAKALRAHGHSVNVLGPSRCHLNYPISSWVLFSTIDSAYKAELPKELSSLRAAVNEADLIHIHTPFGFGFFVAIIARIAKKPFVYTHHTNFFNGYMQYLGVFNTRLTRWTLLKLYVQFLSLSSLVIVPTQATFSELCRIYPSVINKSRTLLSFGYQPVSIFRAADKRIIDIVYVGRLAPEKNAKLAINAIVELGKEHPIHSVAIIGDGVERKMLEKISKSVPETKLRFYGNLSNKKVYEVLLQSKLMLFTSTSDTQALVIDEANACGVPIVAVDSLLARERIIQNETGWICSSNIRHIVDRLISAFQILEDRGREIQHECLSNVAYRNLDEWAKDYLNIIESIS